MIRHKNLLNIAALIEFLAGSGLAIFFHWVLHFPEAAYTIFAIGILLSLSTYLIREELDKSRTSLLEQYRHAHELTFAVSQITDHECQAKANELLAGAKRTIALLHQGYIPLDETEFYMEGAKCADQSQRQIRAVDPVTPGWASRGALVNFYQANLRALERGVRITRVFVINRADLAEPEIQKIISTQISDGIDVRVALRDELPSASDISGRDTSGSCDFAIYDDRVVTDVFGQSGKYYGRKTSEPAEVAKYLHLYDLIEHSSHLLAMDGERIILATEALALAS